MVRMESRSVRWKRFLTRRNVFSQKHFPSVEAPGPYLLSLPHLDVLPSVWYVVDYGTDPGIFADRLDFHPLLAFTIFTGVDRDAAEEAIANVPGGHYHTVEGWLQAAFMYNRLHHQGGVVCICIF